MMLLYRPKETNLKESFLILQSLESVTDPKAAKVIDFEAIGVALKRKKPSSSLDKSVEQSLGIASFCRNTSKASISLHEFGFSTSAIFRSNESNVSQDQHWKCLMKKHKDLNDQHCEFAELDSISIDTAIFEDGAGYAMPLVELTHQCLGDISSDVDVLLEDLFKKHGDYDAVRLSTSQKVTRYSHQELLSAAQQCLDTADEERVKMDKHLEELQKVLTRAEKELKVWTSKKKKAISLIEEHQKRLSENQETITNHEDEIHVIDKMPLLEKKSTS
ncbi:hypothetical protein H5410_004862 [Solanum commersonii]|uniref:Uncharacterized protein n=1 Tax=Solanum commersonii TaxID=4109 RepID=A0A9J6A612_SOLCO|nr:hypothetical protein H5410_004862 [Solanum commersonii]